MNKQDAIDTILVAITVIVIGIIIYFTYSFFAYILGEWNEHTDRVNEIVELNHQIKIKELKEKL